MDADVLIKSLNNADETGYKIAVSSA